MGRAERDGGAVGPRAGVRLAGPATAPADVLPSWATLARAPNPGPMTLSGTNSWILRAPGAPECVVVDPGPADESHLARLAASGPRVSLTLVTHGHPDHVEGLPRYRDLVDGEIRAADPGSMGSTPEPLRSSLADTRSAPLRDGEVIEAAGLRIEVLATPGHTADSVCFLVTLADRPPQHREPALLTGDTVLGSGTTVVMWPDGDLGAYLASLQRLCRLDSRLDGPGSDAGPLPVLPGHGPALADCAAAAGFYLAHRRARLGQVRAARAGGATSVAAVLDAVYPDLSAALRPAAERTVRAQLAYLEQDIHPEALDSP